MSIFYSYVLRDVLEVEPVYFQGRVAVTAASTAEEDTAGPLDTQGPYHATFEDIIMHRLTERYVGKIVPGCGLCVAIHEILQYTEGIVRGPSASAWLTAQFRLCVFAPTPGARLRATISAQTREGIFLTLDFFQFVFFVPGDLLVAPSSYHEESRCWALHVEGEEEEEEALESALNPYVNGDEVVVKVERVIVRELVDFHGNVGGNGSGNLTSPVAAGKEDSLASQSPMEVCGSFVGTGLGPVLWFEK
ncbi:DNA-directed RNA polymerase III subunit [Trypanosoma rangeli]|uniref:DNA-directed RNA polymerase III subunit n=1 Tax=Trypanosoma rangeli TaxID=5698 RepID=A0A422MXM4_TRYRA|nr:DNA-directed RNA polymerase III subunit [Trypanosoma rangeli]RNE97975.1 DNA-directed RNA polymerase III subunit [Trypanosoma rangeli]|eukprot:RNE97975.1 DNA-directed RNA polymerase III subunit [Trypanosoma rangeli]